MNASAPNTKGLKLVGDRWRFSGDAAARTIVLVTDDAHKNPIMQFTRWGADGVQPSFLVPGRGMVPAVQLLKFDNGPESITGLADAKLSQKIHGYGIARIDHPAARCIESGAALYRLAAALARSGIGSSIGPLIADAKALVAYIEGPAAKAAS